jgi:predicted NAD/FAD-binding protein
MFRDLHLVPMASALWSSPSSRILSFPAKYLLQFMANHQMLQVEGRPQWRVVRGGSNSYVKALRARWRVQERLSTPVRMVLRDADGVTVFTDAGAERFDQLVLACHSDQALRLLSDAGEQERGILGAMPYQANETVLHTDASLLPGRRKAWAAWNAYVPRAPGDVCTVSYCMNLLQGLDAPEPFVVTLNRTDAIDPAKILRRMQYHHPVYSHASVAAQARKAEIQGRRRTWFAVDVARALGVEWPAATAPQPALEATA